MLHEFAPRPARVRTTDPENRGTAVPIAAWVGLFLAVMVAATGKSVEAQETPIKIAVVNLEAVVAQSASGRALGARLEQFQRDAQAEAERMQTSMRDIQRQVAEGGLNDDQMDELRRRLEELQIAFRSFTDDKQREGQRMQTEGLQEIERSLEPVFRQVRDEGGYDLILNNVPGVVVMAGERIDITQIIIDRLNAGS